MIQGITQTEASPSQQLHLVLSDNSRNVLIQVLCQVLPANAAGLTWAVFSWGGWWWGLDSEQGV